MTAKLQIDCAREVPEEVRRALEGIAAGGIADDFESQTLDFKVDSSVFTKNGKPVDEVVVPACICMANGDGGRAWIVVGVAERKRGIEAFAGTACDVDWLKNRVFCTTNPHLTVDVVEMTCAGTRLLLVAVPEGLTVYTGTRGQASFRFGKSCEPMNEEQRRRITFERSNPDYTAKPVDLAVEDLDGNALAEARRLIARRDGSQSGTGPHTNWDTLGHLGLLTEQGKLSKAAEILFAARRPYDLDAQILQSTVPGAEPVVNEIAQPLVFGLPFALRVIQENLRNTDKRARFSNGQEYVVPVIPRAVVDEAVTNAFAHRDWITTSPIVVEQSSTSLRVISPGSLVAGVREDRLLTTPSAPRNPTLMRALRVMGMVEELSRGFDRMWVACLRFGYNPPRVENELSFFSLNVRTGRPDMGFVQATVALTEELGLEISQDLNALLVLWELKSRLQLSLREAARILQTEPAGADEAMERLVDIGIVEPCFDDGLLTNASWRLTETARSAFPETQAAQVTTHHASTREWIEQRLEAGESLSTAECAHQLGIPREDMTAIFRGLRADGLVVIDPNGPSRGRGTRWVKS
ncbi:ATP-binding protein [Corynebacterium mendelii]|uniref:Schlafen AlbA-2 domain-containing protein n=1 Tax=Corynebacterium mendelii TaxID=2765362 RepID=A0A939E1G5_9CORY|nr:ATP-binding protein [Corynebacterium mendelii]MBN9643727.1 hypothetical protein [Corynebacterium mendelii]